MSARTKSPKQILEAASPKARKVVNEILSIEHEYQSYRNIGAAGSVEKEISARIKQLIEREVKR
tara:strand:- start:7865 stop:8056 length:192 start_codon:yes stop_codon:yes gene_type:complete